MLQLTWNTLYRDITGCAKFSALEQQEVSSLILLSTTEYTFRRGLWFNLGGCHRRRHRRRRRSYSSLSSSSLSSSSSSLSLSSLLLLSPFFCCDFIRGCVRPSVCPSVRRSVVTSYFFRPIRSDLGRVYGLVYDGQALRFQVKIFSVD